MSLFARMMKEGVDDLVMCSNPSNSELAGQLGARYQRQLIYTWAGETLISVNPYQKLPIYGDEHIRQYQNSSLRDSMPHIYCLAEQAYRRMANEKESQAVIISGESGAGKTEAAKLILNYVSSVSGSSGDSQRVKDIILQCNPLLESLGNAKTVRNDNSSRFGKYLEVQFNARGEPIGGVTSNFLLEKTRVVFQQRGERNYHVFYQLLAGASKEMRDEFQLQAAKDYFYTSGMGGVLTIDGLDDQEECHRVFHAMSVVGINSDEMWHIYQVLAGILHLGNVRFQGDAPSQVSDRYPAEMASFLFGIDVNTLIQSLNHRQITTGSRTGSVYFVPQNPDQASQIRDALAKEMYSRVFDLVVARINQTMSVRSGSVAVIGILDIYGFELFERNSFEQFCINFVNEKLQQIFIDLTVKSEQREYHEEGLKWRDIDFFDNIKVIELIEGKNPPGLMRMLDDVCRTVHAVDSATADAKFMEKIQKGVVNNPYFQVNVTNGVMTHFTIQHYAGEVVYSADEFCFKNNDSLFTSLISCVQTSQNGFVKSLWPENIANNKQAPTTSGTKIRVSAEKLVEALRKCTPHYIRTIKPNDRKAPMTFDGGRVQHQVKYLGLLENIKVKRAGFAYRHFYHHFLDRFGCLMDQSPTQSGRAGVEQLVQFITTRWKEISVEEFGYGKTKIFVRSPETIYMLADFRDQKMDPVGYKQRLDAFKQSERDAKRAQGATYGLKPKCIVM